MASPLNEKTEAVHPRAWGRVALILFALLLCIGPHLVWRIFSRHSPFAQLFLRMSAKFAGVDVDVQGTAVQDKVLYLANHLSWLDILILAGRTGTAFVAKADMESWPVLGWLADQNNTVYVKRERLKDAQNQANALQAALLSGQPVTLFPEGTTVGGRDLLPFRSSLIAAVVPAPESIAIQPVAIDYGDAANFVAWTDAEAVGHNALRIMSRPGRLPVKLHFLEPLDHADFNDRKAIAAYSRAEIAEALGNVRLLEERLF